MVNFKDGELVKGAYVIIDGKEYEVHMPKYSGETPLSAENLNKVQNDLKSEIMNESIYINNKITNANTYSTEEINTGEKWIDGKAIYKKVIVVKDLSTASRISDNTIALGESLDTAWCDGGFCYYSSNKYQYPLDNNVGVTIQISASNNNLRILNDNLNQRTMDFYVIVKYTKQEA